MCQDRFDGVQPQLFRSFSLSTSVESAERDLEHQLRQHGWARTEYGSFTKMVADQTFLIDVSVVDDVLTFHAHLTSFDVC